MINLRTTACVLIVAVLAGCSSAEQRAEKYLARAQSSFESGDHIKAREMLGHLQRVVELDPEHVEARTKIAQLYMRYFSSRALDRSAKERILGMAREQVEALEAIAPEDETVRLLQPMLRFHGSTLTEDSVARAEALGAVETIFDEDPGNVLATSFLAGVYAGDQPDRSLDFLNRSLEANPQAALRLLKIGLLQSQNRLSEAEQEYIKLVDANPGNKQVKYGLVKFYSDSGQLEKAEGLLRRVVEESPEDAQAKQQLARFLAGMNKIDEAEELLRAEIAADPDNYDYPYLLAQVYSQTDRIDEAEELLLGIADGAGTAEAGLKARNQLARLRLTQDRKAEAEELVDSVLADEAANAEALMMKAALDLERGDTDASVSNLRSVLRNDPTSESALTLMARAQTIAGNPELAKEALQKLIAAHPSNQNGRRELARLMVRERQWDDVRNLLVTGVQLHPDDVQMTRMLVDTLIRLGDWDTAQLQADRIVEGEDTRALGHYLQGRIHQARENYDGAIVSFKTAIDLQPRAIEPLTNLVRVYVANDDIPSIEAYLQEFLATNSDHVHAQTLLAEVYARQEKWSEAIEANDGALNMDARWVPAYRNLIGLHLLRGELDAAERAADGALEVLPENIDLKMLLATVYERQQRFDEAIAIYREQLQRNPDLDIAANNYAALVADHAENEGQLAEALQLAQRFRNTDNPIFLDTLGWLLYRTGDYDGAVKLLEQAVRGAASVPQLRYHLGMAYYKVDRLDGAKSELQAAVSATQGFFGIEEARQTLELL